MAAINFPNPEDHPLGWIDPNGQAWQHDGHGWLAVVPDSNGGALPPGGKTFNVLTKIGTTDGAAVWSDLDAQYF